ncbi:MAG TPA: M48 family metallopeptidase [Burkholderiales bacterium]|nr:M48 family metallopeptidase [Burkholderiales bacterium]
MRTWLIAARIALGIALPVLAGCAANAVTGRSQLLLVSEEQAISGSASAYTTMIGGLDKKKRLERGTARVERVKEITNRLVAEAVRFRPDSANWRWEVQVIDEPKTVNAFCMAGGKMGIYTGFWEKLHASDDEVAAVMGHEIGHALASHTRERMSVSMATGIVTAVLAAAVSNSSNYGRNSAALGTAAAVAVTLPNSREGETEADQIGIELAARAGYDPRAAVTLWQKMAKEGGGPIEFLSTHPSPENRAQRLNELIAKVDPLYRRARANPARDLPDFLSPNPSERPAGTASRTDYVARVAAEPEVMTFVSEDFDRFKSGKAVFSCTTECALAYGFQKSTWKTLYEKHQWRDLALRVMKVGYDNDLSYFLLAEAANGMGLKDAAATYRRRAKAATAAGKTCGGSFNTCEGLLVGETTP